MESIAFEGELSLPVVRQALYLVGKPGPELRWIFTVLAAPLGLASLGFAIRDRDATGLLIAAFFLAMTAYIWLAPRFSARRVLAANEPLHGRMTGELRDEEIEIRNELGQGRYPLSLYKRCKASKNLVILVHRNGALSLFPRDFFASDAHFESFRDAVGERVPRSREVRRWLVPLVLWLVILGLVVVVYSLRG